MATRCHSDKDLTSKLKPFAKMSNLEKVDEEFNNFMYRVNEVSSIIKKLGSDDKNLQEIGNLEADRYLKEVDRTVLDRIDENDVVLKIKSDRTVINKKATAKVEDQATMSQEAFMAEVSRDADQRYKDRMVRTERMETFKKQATLAFRRGEYERALNCYNKAIEQIRDSVMLYCNRCLTYINLGFFDRAIADAQTALRLNEESLKARLLLAKAHLLNGNADEFESDVREAKEKNSDQIDLIDEYLLKLTTE